MDPFARSQMLEDISRFMRDDVNDDGDGRTVVFATQAMEEVRRLADYVAFLVDGEYLGLHEKDTLLEGGRRSGWIENRKEISQESSR